LIHSEKMASLGELTAGIAHEIQNPLNFVNNFSEVSKELLLELQDELEAGNTDEVADIVSNIIQNLQKINHHGKRADAIVKGMLQHSRAGSGSKEPTNINAITEEYVRLAYLGLRAKDNSVKPVLKTDFDKNIGSVNINTADIGRVIVNLVSNAFYAIGVPPTAGSERAKQEPTVWISTKKQDEKVLLTVRDNGPGIPRKVLEKIFQPFFTTKPTGQGTGLGLSLSYDIAKAHGGEILVDTEEGKGTAFTIVLPAA
jgi:two-component system NtrC family sensor kinase